MTSPTEEKPNIDETLAYALQLYREDKITEHEFGEMLGLETRLEIDEVLKANNCFIDYTEDEVAAQRQAVTKERHGIRQGKLENFGKQWHG